MKTNSLAPRLFERNAACEGVSGVKYEQHVDCTESMDDSSSTDSQTISENVTPESKSHREVPFAMVPEKYQHLKEHDEKEQQEEKKKRKKEKYKKVRKNVRKALKCTWKCLVLGLYNFALGYSVPMPVASTFGPDFQKGRSWP